MIESSIIKLILIIGLNICFVCVWAYKEKLRKVNIFKNEKLSIFWAFNVLYLIVTAKVFEKILDITLDFSYDIEYLKKSIETPFFKIDYFGVKTLNEIADFILDTNNLIALFIGVTALMIPIYIYIIGFKSKSKRQLLLMLTKKGDMFYISFFIYVMLFFKVEKLFLVGAIGYLIYLLMEAVKWIMKIENSLYSFEGLDKILKLQEEEEIVELYNATLNELYQGVKDSNVSKTDETQKLLLLLLGNNVINLKGTEKLIRSLYDIYDVAIKNQDDDIFHKISHLHIFIAQYYLRNNDKENFYWALCGMGKVYDYHYKNGTDKFALDVVSGFRFDTFGIYEQYKENFEEGKLWYSKKFRAIMEGIKRAIKNNDFYFFKEFTYLIKQEFEYKDDLKRDYELLGKSVYFGVLLYLREDKRKRRDDRIQYKKIDEFIRFMEKRILNDTSLIGLIELYEFIGGEMIGNSGMLNWESYFEPKMELVKATVWDGREKNERDKLFFELLGKIKFKEWEKNCILTGKLEKYVYINGGFKGAVEIAEDKLLERINKFKKRVNWLLNDLEQYKKELALTSEEYEKIRELFEEIGIATQNQEDKTVVDSGISESKISIFTKELEKILSESRVIKWLKNLGKYKEGIKDEKGKARYIGQYMQKKFFVEIGDEGGTKAIAESYGKGQNKAIEQIIIDKLNVVMEESDRIEDVLKNIKGEPWIILTGISIFNFFYDIKEGSTNKNTIIKASLDKKYFEKYGEILEGIYKYKGMEIPIYNFSSNKKGIYILDSDDIEEFVHYDPKEELEEEKNISKEFDDVIKYAYLKITDTKDIIEANGKEKVLKYEFLKGDGTTEEKLNQFKQLVWISFIQKGELKLKKDAKVYKIEFNG